MILLGDCRATLRTLEPDSVQTCVTSPPYWGLRDYGTATWEGGAEDCDHGAARTERRQSERQSGVNGGTPGSTRDKPRTRCDCGARRIDSQLGLEETPDAYVANMVEVFREVRRVLRPDGTLWLNLGDSYAANRAYQVSPSKWDSLPQGQASKVPDGLKPKDLCGIPWRVAFALQADGWWLRSDIIWAKPNPMPESVTDRPTKAHEYVFLLSKSASYFYDSKAIAEPVSQTPGAQAWRRIFDPSKQSKESALKDAGTKGGNDGRRNAFAMDRNARSIWSIASEPYDGAHFAVMPSALAARCILAGSQMGDMVLDPFLGSGTVGMVAEELGRRWVGCELNPEFEKLIRQRTAQRGLFVQQGAA